MGKVDVVLGDGRRGTVDEKDVAALPYGSRVVTDKELATERLEADYAKQSTGQKVLGVAKYLGPAGSIANLVGGGGDAIPEAEAYREGVSNLSTGGLAAAGTRAATDYVSGKATGDAYAEKLDRLKMAHPELYTAGQAAGVVGAAFGGAEAGVAGAIGKAGGVAERVVAEKALGSLAAKGVAGRAAVTGGSLAARGAFEGAAYAGVEQASDNILHDKAIGEKLYTSVGHGALLGGELGGILGVGGSLAASGARAAGRGIMSKLARGAEGEAATLAEGGVREAAAVARPKGLGGILDDPSSAARNMSNELAFDALGTTAAKATKILQNVEGGANAVGEYVNRIHLAPPDAAGGAVSQSIKAGTNGRADQLYEAIKADKYGRVAEGLGSAVKDTPARFNVEELVRHAEGIHTDMIKDPTRVAGADAFLGRVKMELGAVNTAGKIAADGTMDAAEAYYTRASLERGAYELGGTSNAAKGAYKEFLRKWDSSVVDTIDRAAAEAGSTGARDNILHWKREYQLASAAEAAAKDGAKRVLRNNIFGLREGVGAAVGLVTGHPLGAVAGAVGMKLLRERGAATGAAFLSRMADSNAIQAMSRRHDMKIANSAGNLLREERPRMPTAAPEKSPKAQAVSREQSRAQSAATQAQAQAITTQIGEFSANPAKHAEAIQEAAAIVGRSAGPKAAEDYTAAAMRAIRFIAAHIPIKERRDPLDPRSVPPFSQDESDRLVRATRYALQPDTVFDDFGRGIITPEGLRAAKTLAPESFAMFQDHLLDRVTDHMLRNKRLTWSHRLQLDKLGIESIRPETVARLQANFAEVPPEPTPAGPAGPAPGGPVNMTIQQAGFDAIEQRRAGAA